MDDISTSYGVHTTKRPDNKKEERCRGVSLKFMEKIKSLMENAETKSDIDQISRLIHKEWRRSIKPNLTHKLAREYRPLTEHFWVTCEDDFEFDTYTDRQARITIDKGTHKSLVMKTIDLKTGKARYDRIQVDVDWIDNTSPQDNSKVAKYRLWTTEKKCKAFAKARRNIESALWDNLFEPSNPVEILGLSMDYTDKELRTAWRRYANLHHPDKGGDPEKFSKGLAAYEVLKQ